jgi:pimeloyl-ACP methyl ester carboxylesterase
MDTNPTTTNDEVQLREIRVLNQPARIYEGGNGTPILLIHGGWGGAAMHWSRVFPLLVREHHVVAPDLPGLGWTEQPALANVAAYATWVQALLDTLDIPSALCVGNSFGGSLAWSFASRYPERCTGVVIVNGFPMPKTPAPLAWLGKTRVGGAMMRRSLLRNAYHPKFIPQAFVDPSKAPAELVEMLDGARRTPRVENFAKILIAGDGAPRPLAAPLLLWGAGDRMPGTTAECAEKIRRAVGASKLRFVDGAGHFPQVERPEAFVQGLGELVGDQSSVQDPRDR